MKRACGVLLPISSLPSKYGIGCFSKEAYQWIDQLKEAGQSYWQILPLTPTSFGDSPYQSPSSFAGNPYFIDLEELIEDGLLTKKECDSIQWGSDSNYVDYDALLEHRLELLKKAFENEKLESAIPEGTKVNSCILKGNTVYVDLSKEFIDNAPSGITEESMAIYSIVNTLTELNEVSGIKILINGEENKAFNDNAISFKDVFVKND